MIVVEIGEGLLAPHQVSEPWEIRSSVSGQAEMIFRARSRGDPVVLDFFEAIAEV